MNKLMTVCVVLLVGLSALYTGCSSRTNYDNGEIKVGVVLSLSGPAATYGQEVLNGLELAIDQLNPGREKKIKLIVLDDKGELTETVNSITQLIEVSRVDCVVGAVASTNTLAGAKVAQESHVPMVVPISTNADITKTGDYISRICFSDPFQGKVLANFAINDLRAKKAVVVTDKANDYSIGLSESFREHFTSLGGEIVGAASYSAGDADFSALVTTVSAFQPEVIFIAGMYSDAGVILKQSRGAWDKIYKLGGDGWDSPSLVELAGPPAFGSYISSHFAPDDPNLKVQEFVRLYKERHGGETPGAMACLGYDAAHVLVEAIDRVEGDFSRDKLNAAIRATKGMEGISGTISLDSQGDAIKDAVILEVNPDGFKFKARVRP